MNAEDVAAYLQNNPQFFDCYADLLAEINLPHPHGGRTISLAERQMLTLRTNNKGLEKRLREMVEYGKENDALQDKVHRFTLTLFGAHDLIALQDAITRNLREIFSIPHVALHVWKGLPPCAEVLVFADRQQTPVCAHHAVHDTAGWFGESASHLKSFAYLPLREGNGEAVGNPAASSLRGLREGNGEAVGNPAASPLRGLREGNGEAVGNPAASSLRGLREGNGGAVGDPAASPLRGLREGNGEAVGNPAASSLRGLREGEQSIGLLVFASEDAQRFYPEMGTLFLQRIAEIASAALQPRL